MSKIGYKVVTVKYNNIKKYFSCMVGDLFGIKYSEEYFIGKWTKRDKNKGGLAVFDDLGYVRDFIFRNHLYLDNKIVIFKCKYTKSKVLELSIDLKRKPKMYNCRFYFIAPLGTVLAEKVKLLEEIKL